MVTDANTNKVYFSMHLTAYKCWRSIADALETNGVAYGMLPNTKDNWARDFMPIQIGETDFVKYIYNPDYLAKAQPYITNDVSACYDFTAKQCHELGLILDGGNIIKCNDCIIATDKVFHANPSINRETIVSEMEAAFGCRIIFIPWDRYEEYGHSDGMVRFVEPCHVVINHYMDFDKPLRKRLLSILLQHFDRISELHYGKNARIKSWAHINFLRVGDLLLVPQMGIPSDALACEQLSEIYAGCTIVPVDAKGIVKNGGGLNCVSWNVRECDVKSIQ